MTRRRAALLLVLCVVAIVVATPHALVGGLMRFTQLSFDDPATQLLDELTCEKASHTDPFRETAARLRVGAGGNRRLTARDVFGAVRPPSLTPLEARAPPTV